MVYTTYLRWFGGWFIYPNVLFFANKDDYIEPIEQPGEFECCMCGSPGVPHWNRRIRSLDIKQNTYFEFPIWTHIHVIPTGDLQCLMDHVLHMYIYILWYVYTRIYMIHTYRHSSFKKTCPQLILAIELVFRLNPSLLGRNGHWFLVIWTSPFFCCSTSMG
jgi:hypothetical protein